MREGGQWFTCVEDRTQIDKDLLLQDIINNDLFSDIHYDGSGQSSTVVLTPHAELSTTLRPRMYAIAISTFHLLPDRDDALLHELEIVVCGLDHTVETARRTKYT